MLPLRYEICVVMLILVQVVVVKSFYEEKEQEKYTTAKLNITICDSLRKWCGIETIHKEGIYGVHSLESNAGGWLFKLNGGNSHGCTVFNLKIDVRPWIALVKRGSCFFDKKIENAFNHNASAIIIYDSKDDEKPNRMLTPGARDLVSVSVTKEDGEKLATRLRNNETIYVEIVSGLPHSKWTVNPTSVLFVSVSFIVLMVISLAWLVFYYVQRFRYVHARDKTEKRLSSAAKKAIAKLPTRTVSKKDEDKEIDSCPVCLDGYKGGDSIRILPCQHEYHKMCIDPWLVEHRTCPMCKLNILKELGVTSSSDTQSNDSRDIEAATIEPPDYEDHQSAVDNPVVFLGDVEPDSLQSSRRPSCGGESSESTGSSATSARVLHVSADINWEREDQTSSTSNLVDSSLRT